MENKKSVRYNVFISWLLSYFFILLIPLCISIIVYTKSVNNIADELSNLHDYGIVFGTGKIGERIIDQFSGKLINVHRGIIQEYRGLDSDLWAIYHNDFGDIGTTIHLVEKQLDAGPVINQGRILINKDMKIYQLRYYTTIMAADLVIEAIEKNILPQPQSKLGRYYSHMPLILKKTVAEKFDKYVANLC